MKIPYGKPTIDDEDIKAVVDVLKSDFLTTGPKIKEFEEKFAEQVGAKYAVAVSNGTAALHLSCLAVEIKEKDEVITSPITFAASANCALYCRAKPIFVDINEQGLIDENKIENSISSNTKAIIPVHYSGLPCNMEEIKKLADKYNLIIIEDACHALGAKFKDSKIGDCKYSDLTVFSFHPVKHITTGEGGMITTNSKELYEKLISLRTHGMIKDKDKFLEKNEDPWYHEMQDLGYNYRITDIQCALGISQLNKLENFVNKRREIAKNYDKAFEENNEIKIIKEKPDQFGAYHLYIIKLKNKKIREELFKFLKEKNIFCQVHYIPVYWHPFYQKQGYVKGICLASEEFYEKIISMPIYPSLKEEEQEYVIEQINNFFKQKQEPKLKIALGDLRHDTIGKHSVYMPISVGYIAAYLLKNIPQEKIEIKLYSDPNIIFKEIDEWKPDVIALSNYCWNTELSSLVFRYSKEKNKKTICIAGGPEFPEHHKEIETYLLNKPEIDFYIYGEGETTFLKLIEKILDKKNLIDLKCDNLVGVAMINPLSKKLLVGNPLERLKYLDDIPSPYLMGLMDKWFDGSYAPSLEFARGCPFSCKYCFTGRKEFNYIARFSIERIKKELNYIAERMQKYPNILLSICDSNFGMYEEDEKIAEHLSYLQNRYNWPNVFDVTTGKLNYDRILRIASLLKNKMDICGSLQSSNKETLKIIARKNPSEEEYEKIIKEKIKRNMPSITELIIPLPEETKESFFNTIEKLYEKNVEKIVTYTTMLLKGTYLGSEECKKKYSMKTKFRVLPRQFGEYKRNKCFEIEEVCIETNTMCFEDYLECRGLALIASLLSERQFDIVRKHLKELKISFGDYLQTFLKFAKSGGKGFPVIYEEFIKETKQELWNSKEEIYDFYSEKENYEKLLNGEVGDNLIRKYKTKSIFEYGIFSIEFAYFIIKELLKEKKLSNETFDSLENSKKWSIANRDIYKLLIDENYRKTKQKLSLDYDVNSWYLNKDLEPLINYKNSINYEMTCDFEKINEILKEGKKLYGENISYYIGKILTIYNIENFWKDCKKI